jgi:hypothetical protein
MVPLLPTSVAQKEAKTEVKGGGPAEKEDKRWEGWEELGSNALLLIELQPTAAIGAHCTKRTGLALQLPLWNSAW